MEDNLALAYVSCSLHKAARQRAEDPSTGGVVPIYSPRRQLWDGVRLLGTTATWRATIAALSLNRPVILAIRAEEALLGRHPLH